MATLRRAATGLASPGPASWTRRLAPLSAPTTTTHHHQPQPSLSRSRSARYLATLPKHHRPAPTTTITRRSYHSYEHPPSRGPFTDAEAQILAAAHAHVPALGFSAEALAQGARDAGYPGVSTAALRDGPFSLVRYHLVTRREALACRSKELFGDAEAGSQAEVSARVEKLAWERLMRNKEVVHRWAEALALMSQPSHLPTSLQELARLADEIWFLAGDTAVDPSWYAKRASLSTLYAATELFMINDSSPEFADTHAFLRRRLEGARLAGQVLGAVGEWVGFTASAGVNVLRSKGVRI